MTAAVMYYAFQVRLQNRLRQTDLVMKLYGTWDSVEFQRAWDDVYYDEFLTFEDVMEKRQEKRPTGSYVFYFYEGVGVLLRRRLIDADLVGELFGITTCQMWERIEPMIVQARQTYEDPNIFRNFEYLCGEVKKRRRR